MTNYGIAEIAKTSVPPRAMTTALMVACRLGDDTRPTSLLMIARQHGGTILMAQAMELRLAVLATLLETDPSIPVVTAKLGPDQIGTILAERPARIRENQLEIDTGALAAAVRQANERFWIA